MSYMLLIVEPPGQRAERGLEAGKQVYARMLRFADELKERGVLRSVESLANDARGVRVQVREGRQRLVDGPFTEACPAAAWATIEVRELGPCWA